MLKNMVSSLVEYTKQFDITNGTLSNPEDQQKQGYVVVYKDRSNNTVRSPKIPSTDSSDALHKVRSRLLLPKRHRVNKPLPSKMMAFSPDKLHLAQAYYEKLKSQNS